MPVVILPDNQPTFGLSTLAAQTALKVQQYHETNMKRAFLVKHVKGGFSILGLTATQGPVLLFMARGNRSTTQIKTAIENAQLGPDQENQAQVRDVLWETVMMFTSLVEVIHLDVTIGGGKGIPFNEAEGWAWYAYNLDTGALTTGATVHFETAVSGVWL